MKNSVEPYFKYHLGVEFESYHRIPDFRYLLHLQRDVFDLVQQAPFGADWAWEAPPEIHQARSNGT
jgi:hypothetical protein